MDKSLLWNNILKPSMDLKLSWSSMNRHESIAKYLQLATSLRLNKTNELVNNEVYNFAIPWRDTIFEE